MLEELTTFLDSSDQNSVLKAVRGIIDAQGSDPVTALWVRRYMMHHTVQLPCKLHAPQFTHSAQPRVGTSLVAYTPSMSVSTPAHAVRIKLAVVIPGTTSRLHAPVAYVARTHTQHIHTQMLEQYHV